MLKYFKKSNPKPLAGTFEEQNSRYKKKTETWQIVNNQQNEEPE